MIKGLIFDLDGTLIDSIGDIHYAINLALKEHGYKEKSYDFVKLNTGRGFYNLVKDCLDKNTSEEIINEVNKTYTKLYGEHCSERTTVYPGIHETLIKLQEKGIKLAVNSNKKDIYTKKLMKEIFPDINFLTVMGEVENIKVKPDPTIANMIVEMMNLNKDEVMYVGDSEVDIRTSKNAKLNSIGCTWGFRGREILEKEEATFIIDKPNEILKMIGE